MSMLSERRQSQKVMKVKMKSYSTLCNPVDCNLPGSSVYGIFQARILEWVAISFSRRSSQPRDWTQVSCIVGRCFTVWVTREVSKGYKLNNYICMTSVKGKTTRMENISGCQRLEKTKCLTKSKHCKDAFGAKELFFILDAVVITQIYIHVEIHRTVHRKAKS